MFDNTQRVGPLQKEKSKQKLSADLMWYFRQPLTVNAKLCKRRRADFKQSSQKRRYGWLASSCGLTLCSTTAEVASRNTVQSSSALGHTVRHQSYHALTASYPVFPVTSVIKDTKGLKQTASKHF